MRRPNNAVISVKLTHHLPIPPQYWMFQLMLQTPPQPLASTSAPPRLTRPREQAAQLITNQIKIGHAIKEQRIVYVEDLDEARAEKQEWVVRTTELLKQLFSDGSVAEQCNDW